MWSAATVQDDGAEPGSSNHLGEKACPCRKPNPAGNWDRIAQCFGLMREACSLVWLALVGLFRSRASLEAEILILRHQLNIQRLQSPKRLNFSTLDRLIFAGLYRLAPSVLGALAILKPETVICWHRAGFRSYWRWKSRHRGGRPTVPLEIRELIREMSIANPLWSAATLCVGPTLHSPRCNISDAIGQERTKIDNGAELLGRL